MALSHDEQQKVLIISALHGRNIQTGEYGEHYFLESVRRVVNESKKGLYIIHERKRRYVELRALPGGVIDYVEISADLEKDRETRVKVGMIKS